MNQLKPNKCNISCEWLRTGRVLINPDGQVLPCCYLANAFYMTPRLTKENNPKDFISNQIGDRDIITTQFKQEPVLTKYMDKAENYNVFVNDLEDILQSEWFTITLPQSWNDPDTVIRQCDEFCGDNKYHVK